MSKRLVVCSPGDGGVPIEGPPGRDKAATLRRCARLGTALSDVAFRVSEEAWVEGVILGALENRPEGVSEEELTRIAQWSIDVRTQLQVFALLLRGNLRVAFADGAVEPTVALARCPRGVAGPAEGGMT